MLNKLPGLRAWTLSCHPEHFGFAQYKLHRETKYPDSGSMTKGVIPTCLREEVENRRSDLGLLVIQEVGDRFVATLLAMTG